MVANQMSNVLVKVILPVLLGLAPAWVFAGSVSNQPVPQQGFEQCLGLPDGERLSCYDRIALQTVKPNSEPVTENTTDAVALIHTAMDRSESSKTHETDVKSSDALEVAAVEEDTPSVLSASLMERMWELRADTQRPPFSLQAYHTNYLLFAQYADRVNRSPSSPAPGHQSAAPKDYRQVESKFQLSVRSKLAHSIFRENDSIWFGYTQVSHWQTLSSNISRPFRATSYRPEVMYMVPIQYQFPESTWTLRMAGVGLIHESNGQSNPLSRSWNRAYVGLGLDSDNMSIYARFWRRFPESRSHDDNPDITNYMGRADIRFSWELKHDNALGITIVSNLRSTNKGSVQLDYYFPLSSFWGMGDYLRGYVQVFHGYGETITDYNFRRTAFGIGVAIKQW